MHHAWECQLRDTSQLVPRQGEYTFSLLHKQLNQLVECRIHLGVASVILDMPSFKSSSSLSVDTDNARLTV